MFGNLNINGLTISNSWPFEKKIVVVIFGKNNLGINKKVREQKLFTLK